MQNENRRTFVRTVAVTAASASRILGANDRVNVGCGRLGRSRPRSHERVEQSPGFPHNRLMRC